MQLAALHNSPTRSLANYAVQLSHRTSILLGSMHIVCYLIIAAINAITIYGLQIVFPSFILNRNFITKKNPAIKAGF